MLAVRVVLVSLFAGHACGESAILPGSLEWVLKGQRESKVFEVTNCSNKQETYCLTASALVRMDDGKTSGHGSADVSRGFTAKFEPGTFALAPGAKRPVRLNMIRHAWCTAGRYRTTVCLRTPNDSRPPAKSKVVLVVRPKIGVKTETPVVQGEVHSRQISAMAQFRVEANVPSVQLFVSASPLSFRGDPFGRKVPQIPLDTARGVQIIPTDAVPTGGTPGLALYQGPGPPIGYHQTLRTQAAQFTSHRVHCFYQHVYVKAFWVQDGRRRPAGRYDGRVRLTALVMPDD